MLDVVVGLAVLLLVTLGLLIMFGPSLPRRLRLLSLLGRTVRERVAPPDAALEREPAGLHPTTQKAVMQAARLSSLLRAEGFEKEAAGLRGAARRLIADEPNGIYAMQAALRALRGVGLKDGPASERLGKAAEELRRAIADRAEQLELLPFRKA